MPEQAGEEGLIEKHFSRKGLKEVRRPRPREVEHAWPVPEIGRRPTWLERSGEEGPKGMRSES